MTAGAAAGAAPALAAAAAAAAAAATTDVPLLGLESFARLAGLSRGGTAHRSAERASSGCGGERSKTSQVNRQKATQEVVCFRQGVAREDACTTRPAKVLRVSTEYVVGSLLAAPYAMTPRRHNGRGVAITLTPCLKDENEKTPLLVLCLRTARSFFLCHSTAGESPIYHSPKATISTD